MELEILSGSMVSPTLIHTGIYLCIMPYDQGDELQATNLFCCRTMTSNMQPISLRTNFSIKNKSWKWWFVPYRVLILHNQDLLKFVWDYTKRQEDLMQTMLTENMWVVLQGFWSILSAEFNQKMSANIPITIGAVLKLKVVIPNIDFI